MYFRVCEKEKEMRVFLIGSNINFSFDVRHAHDLDLPHVVTPSHPVTDVTISSSREKHGDEDDMRSISPDPQRRLTDRIIIITLPCFPLLFAPKNKIR